MNHKEQQILNVRNKIMNNRKVLCTGNPNKKYTIASSVIKVYPNATFIHKSNGFDFENIDNETTVRLEKLMSTHNTFINASYIKPYVQSKLLDIANKNMKIGDVFNIGSAYEYNNLGREIIRDSKLDLRKKSLEYNNFRLQTCHIIVGGINKNMQDQEGWIDTDEIIELITWISKQRYKIPVISIDQPKKPW